MNIEYYNSSGVKINRLYQNDTNIKLVMSGIDTNKVHEVHVCNVLDRFVDITPYKVNGGGIEVNIPDKLFLSGKDIAVYIYSRTPNNGFRTTDSAMVRVELGKRPIN